MSDSEKSTAPNDKRRSSWPTRPFGDGVGKDEGVQGHRDGCRLRRNRGNWCNCAALNAREAVASRGLEPKEQPKHTDGLPVSGLRIPMPSVKPPKAEPAACPKCVDGTVGFRIPGDPGDWLACPQCEQPYRDRGLTPATPATSSTSAREPIQPKHEIRVTGKIEPGPWVLVVPGECARLRRGPVAGADDQTNYATMPWIRDKAAQIGAGNFAPALTLQQIADRMRAAHEMALLGAAGKQILVEHAEEWADGIEAHACPPITKSGISDGSEPEPCIKSPASPSTEFLREAFQFCRDNHFRAERDAFDSPREDLPELAPAPPAGDLDRIAGELDAISGDTGVREQHDRWASDLRSHRCNGERVEEERAHAKFMRDQALEHAGVANELQARVKELENWKDRATAELSQFTRKPGETPLGLLRRLCEHGFVQGWRMEVHEKEIAATAELSELRSGLPEAEKVAQGLEAFALDASNLADPCQIKPKLVAFASQVRALGAETQGDAHCSTHGEQWVGDQSCRECTALATIAYERAEPKPLDPALIERIVGSVTAPQAEAPEPEECSPCHDSFPEKCRDHRDRPDPEEEPEKCGTCRGTGDLPQAGTVVACDECEGTGLANEPEELTGVAKILSTTFPPPHLLKEEPAKLDGVPVMLGHDPMTASELTVPEAHALAMGGAMKAIGGNLDPKKLDGLLSDPTPEGARKLIAGTDLAKGEELAVFRAQGKPLRSRPFRENFQGPPEDEPFVCGSAPKTPPGPVPGPKCTKCNDRGFFAYPLGSVLHNCDKCTKAETPEPAGAPLVTGTAICAACHWFDDTLAYAPNFFGDDRVEYICREPHSQPKPKPDPVTGENHAGLVSCERFNADGGCAMFQEKAPEPEPVVGWLERTRRFFDHHWGNPKR